MSEESTRLVDGSREPSGAEVTDFIKSATYADGKWVFVSVDSAKVLSDIKRLLAVKRPPKPGVQARTRSVASRGRAHRATRG